MNDILFSQNSKQHGKNYDITKHDRANKFSLPYHSINFIHDWIFIVEIFFRGIQKEIIIFI